VNIGDGLRVGSAQFRVTQPRMPCYKLGVRFGRDDMVKCFLRSGRTGFYLWFAKAKSREPIPNESELLPDPRVHSTIRNRQFVQSATRNWQSQCGLVILPLSFQFRHEMAKSRIDADWVKVGILFEQRIAWEPGLGGLL
jgi:MOSC domain-containing protein